MSRWVTHGMWTLGSLFLELVTQSTPGSMRAIEPDVVASRGLG